MSLIISIGSNQGHRLKFLGQAKVLLNEKFQLIAESQVYESFAVDYTNQPHFLNQILEYQTPKMDGESILRICQEIEIVLGRIRTIAKGPRTIDIDILFIDDLSQQSAALTIPHSEIQNREFILKPLAELPSFPYLAKKFNLIVLDNKQAWPLSS